MNIFDYDTAKKIIVIKKIGYYIKMFETHNCWEPYQTEITKEILDGNNIFKILVHIWVTIHYYH